MTKREFLDTVFTLAPNEANAIMDAFDEYVDSNEPYWIPVTERLPEKLTRVMVCTEFGFVCIAYLKHNYMERVKPWMIYGADPDIKGNVEWWMPLPDPYKGVTE